MSQCQTCSPELASTVPSDFAPGATYFQPTDNTNGCTDCQALENTNPPDQAAGGGVYFEVPPAPIFPPETIFSDAQTASCPGGSPSVTVPAGAISVSVQAATPDAVAAAKQQANLLALLQAESLLTISGATIADNVCGNQSYSRSFCVPLGSTLVVTGSLPPGLSVSNLAGITAAIFGKPTTGGTYTFVVTATPPSGPAILFHCTINVITVTNPGTLCADGGDVVSVQLAASAPLGAVLTWSLVNSVLPPGLSLSTSGLISGVLSPTTGLYTFTVQVSDSVSGLSCSLVLMMNTGTNHPFDLIAWQALSPADYTFLNNVNILKAVSTTNTPCGFGKINPANQDCTENASGNFYLDYCAGSVGGRLRAVAYGQIGDLTGSWLCHLRVFFGTDFTTNDTFEITVTQGGVTIYHNLFCYPNGGGFCTTTTPVGNTYIGSSFSVGPATNANPIIFQLVYDGADLRGSTKVFGKLIGQSICP